MTKRCLTRSGPFQCDRPDGHSGECVTRAVSKHWIGPALQPKRDGVAVATQLQIAQASTRMAQEAPATTETTSRVSEAPKAAQGGERR